MVNGNYGYNPALYTTKKSTLAFRGVNYEHQVKLYDGRKESETFVCNCSHFTTEHEVQKFINETFFKVPDVFGTV
jgi:hypothetical protein